MTGFPVAAGLVQPFASFRQSLQRWKIRIERTDQRRRSIFRAPAAGFQTNKTHKLFYFRY
jgi:hypothetical protein